MLGSEILKQGQLFLEAAVLGAVLMFIYDGFRIFRRVWAHGAAAIGAEDLLFWICGAWAMFGFMYRQNNGVIRVFLILGVAVGMISYSVFVSRHVVRAGTACLRRILLAARRVIRAAAAPFRRFWRFLWKKTDRSRDLIKKICKNRKKQLKKLGKVVRIGLSKL